MPHTYGSTRALRRISGYSSALIAVLTVSVCWTADDPAAIKPVGQLNSPSAKDQDDFCFWADQRDPSRSTVIASDKTASRLFVYCLDGTVLQELSMPKPGNIDIRQNVELGGSKVDIVVVNQRDGFRLRVFVVNPESRKLERVDNDTLLTGPNYGGCLYHSPVTGKVSFVCTSDKGTVEQYALTRESDGPVLGKKVRSWPLGKCEGAVADDAGRAIYIAEETKGIWKFDAEPEAEARGVLIAEVGMRDQLTGDLEGLVIDRRRDGTSSLIVSDQKSNRFVAFELSAPHRRLGEVRVDGARDSDGIDLLALPLGDQYPEGIFAAHTDVAPRAIQLSSLADVRRGFVPARKMTSR